MIPGLSAGLVGVPAAASNLSLYDAIQAAGLTANLKLCLDAGDSASYTSGQKWLDRSGGGYDFFLGATSSATTDDPTFNGSAGGLSSNEYWSFDGGDFLTYDSTNETWMNALHKDGAAFSVLAAVYVPNISTNNGLFGTNSDATANPGVSWSLGATKKPILRVRSSITSAALNNVIGDDALTINAWNILGLSINENAGVASFHYLNGSYNQNGGSDLWSANYFNPSTADAAQTFQIGALGNGVNPLQVGTRLGWFAMWSSALSKANLDALYASLKGRYGLT